MIGILTGIVAPAVVGFVAAGLTLTTLISAQVGTPSDNPADQAPIVYGSRG